MLLNAALHFAALWATSLAATASPEPCETGRVASIFIDNRSIFDTADPSLDARFARAYRLANSLHVSTRQSVIRRELLFREGDCYDPLLLEESERLLRALEFLSRVDIFGIQQPDGTFHVIVDTQDEWSTQLDLRVGMRSRRMTFDGGGLRERNLLGRGHELQFYYLERDAIREYGIQLGTPQLANTRTDLELRAGRTRAGTEFQQVLEYPFVAEVGRWAARQAFGRKDAHFEYVLDGGGPDQRLLMPVRLMAAELALVRRFGQPGHLTLLGGALTRQELTFPARLHHVQALDYENGELADSTLLHAVAAQRQPLDNVRAVLLLGQRNLRWVRRRGFDSLRGQQDVALGSELFLALGRSLPWIRHDDDLYAMLGVRGGFESRQTFLSTRLRLDGRKDLRSATTLHRGWEDVTVDAEALIYWQPAAARSHTMLLRAAAAGAWHAVTPFQLTLGGERALRGYEPDQFPGGRRLVFSLDNRVYFGWPTPDVLDLGGTLFVDVGHIWPGEVPFGVDSGWKAGVGAGLRAAFPPGSRTTYRLDFALPLDRGLDWSALRMSVSIGEIRGLTPAASRTEPQLGRSRHTSVFGNLLQLPR
jgi:hypothetical protein